MLVEHRLQHARQLRRRLGIEQRERLGVEQRIEQREQLGIEQRIVEREQLGIEQREQLGVEQRIVEREQLGVEQREAGGSDAGDDGGGEAGAKTFGTSCNPANNDGNQNDAIDCGQDYPSCQMVQGVNQCTKPCAPANGPSTDCSAPPTTGKCNKKGYCQ